MNLNKMLKSKFYKVRLNQKDKTFKVTNHVFNTKTEGLKTIKSDQYEIHNVKSLEILLLKGFSEQGYFIPQDQENVSQAVKTSKNNNVWIPLDLTGDEEIEKQIAEYERKKANKEAIKSFFSKPSKIEEVTHPHAIREIIRVKRLSQ